jgi:Protein of unknown function (DUF2934)
MSRTLATESSTHPTQPGPTDSEIENLQERIKLRAYELYEARGRAQGHEQEDWAIAEREVREKVKPHRAA